MQKVEPRKGPVPALVEVTELVRELFPDLANDIFFADQFVHGKQMTDDLEAQMLLDATIARGKGISADMFRTAKRIVANENKKNWLCDFFTGLPEWDGEDRIAGIAFMLSAVDSELYRVYLRKWMMGLPVRAFMPGELVKSILILTGVQGLQKSAFLRALVPNIPNCEPAFTDTVQIGTLKNKPADFWTSIKSCMICEFAELVGNQRDHVDALKNVLSATSVKVRVAYGRHMTYLPITTIFSGTTNESFFLRDSTGNMRMMVIEIPNSKIDVEYIKANLNQIWAQVYAAHMSGEKHWIDDEAIERRQAAHNKKFMCLSSRAEALIDHIDDADLDFYIQSQLITDFGEIKDWEMREAMGHIGWSKLTGITYKKQDGVVKKVPVTWVSPEFTVEKSRSDMGRAICE